MSQNIQKIKDISKRQADLLEGFLYGKEYNIQEIAKFEKKIVSLATLKRDVVGLIKLGFIKSLGTKRGSRYSISPFGLIHNPIDPKQYFAKEEIDRGGATSFFFKLFEILKTESIFYPTELEELEKATKKFHIKSQTSTEFIHQKELERFIIELSWKSSKIEGNTYTLLDTERLLKEGVSASGKTKNETTMVLNHKKAFDFILKLKKQKKEITSREVENIHSLLVDELGVSHGIRHGSVGITGSSYIPLSIPTQIKENLHLLVNSINEQNNFYAKALIALLGISYLQPFEDGNKRTARLLANAYLIMEHLAPLSYRNVDEEKYREATLVFYEKHTIEPFKKIFIEQYIFACENYNLA